MEIKKSPKANLENKKFMFMEVGLIIALLLVLGAFEWSTTETSVSILEEEVAVVIEEEQVPITQEEQLPPPEVPKEPVMSDVIDIVDDDIKVEDNFLISTEDDASLGVEIKDYVVEQQEEEVVEEEEIPFAVVEEKPKFQGKDPNPGFTKWVFSKIVYPEIAKENGVQGRVTLQFTIDTDGSVTNVKVLRGVDSSLDKEAVRVVSSSPKWKPGMQRNKPVKVKYTFPVVFNLR